MLLLIANTSGKQGSVGLARVDSADTVNVIEEVPLVGGTFSAQLVPQIAGLLEKHGFRKTEIGAFVVVSGPGSFTGLRVGLAAIKALAEILQKPIVPVSLLEVIAVSSGTRGRVMAALDAGRGEVFAGEYDVHDSARLVNERLFSKEELLAVVRDLTLATPDENLAQAVREMGGSVALMEIPGAKRVGQTGWRRLQSGHIVSPEQLEANYIRRSDAEIFATHKP